MMFKTWNLGWLAVLPLLFAQPALAAGLPVAKKVLAIKNKALDASIEYPQTGNKAIDTAILAYARHAMDEFKGYGAEKAAGQSAYTLATTYDVARNDGQIFAVLFTEYTDTGGAHPNSNYKTFNFLMPGGGEVLLPEIVDGQRGIDRVSKLALADLIKRIGTGKDAASDKDTITGGAGPLADNFKDFIWLPDRLHIYFPAYQVASYAAGPQETIIPLAALKGFIRPDWRAPQPGFDCHNAPSILQMRACSDATLARLWRQVSEAIDVKRHNAADPAAASVIIDDQIDWDTKLNTACGDTVPVACLTKLFRDRLAVLAAQP